MKDPEKMSLAMSKGIPLVNHDPYVVEFHGFHSSGPHASVAAIVLNRNLPEVTDRLCESILASSTIPIDLFVTESGSDPECVSQYRSFHFNDLFSRNTGLRIARGLNNSLQLVGRVSEKPYEAYWFLTNDVRLEGRVDYVSNGLQAFRAFPKIGIIEHPHDIASCFTLNFAESKAQDRLLADQASYPACIHQHQIAITPFAITRSIFLNGALVRHLNGRILDESNWRGWGADEDLGYRTWNEGHWICVAPFHPIHEDTFLTTRRSEETRTEEINRFKAEATIEMDEFCARRHNTDIRGLRRLAVKEMLRHLPAIVRADLAIAHCFPGIGAITRKMIEDHLSGAVV